MKHRGQLPRAACSTAHAWSGHQQLLALPSPVRVCDRTLPRHSPSSGSSCGAMYCAASGVFVNSNIVSQSIFFFCASASSSLDDDDESRVATADAGVAAAGSDAADAHRAESTVLHTRGGHAADSGGTVPSGNVGTARSSRRTNIVVGNCKLTPTGGPHRLQCFYRSVLQRMRPADEGHDTTHFHPPLVQWRGRPPSPCSSFPECHTNAR